MNFFRGCCGGRFSVFEFLVLVIWNIMLLLLLLEMSKFDFRFSYEVGWHAMNYGLVVELVMLCFWILSPCLSFNCCCYSVIPLCVDSIPMRYA